MYKQLLGLYDKWRDGRITRRDFIRYAMLLGLSLGAAETLAACAPQGTPAPTATSGPAPKPTWTLKAAPTWDPLWGDPNRGEDNVEVTPDWLLPTPTSAPSATPAPTEPAPPTSVPTPTAPGATPIMWERATWACPSCEQRFATQKELLQHISITHIRKVPGARKVSQPTYAQFLTADIARFDQHNTVFSRVMWDKDYQQELAKVVPRQSQEPPLVTSEQMAMRQGAIYVDDTVGSLHANYTGFSGHLRGVGGLYDWDDPVNPKQYPVSDPAAMSERIKQVARFYGADLVGITQINPLWVYSHFFDRETGACGKLEIPYQYALVLGIEMSWPEINTSPAWGASAATALAYSQMAELSAKLAKYIRMLGYPAVPSGNDTAQSIPLAIDAGLGELGRLGLLLTPEFGPRQRLCKVLTNLPLATDQPIDFGIQRFCEGCFVCAKNCPPRAIRFEARTTEPTSISNRPGILRWPVNVSQCYRFWRENGKDCSNCVRACPWSAPNRNWL